MNISENKQDNATGLRNPEDDLFDQLPTQTNLPVIHEPRPAPYFMTMDGMSIEEQITWIIPAIRVSTQAPKLEVRGSGAESYSAQLRNVLKSSGIYALSSLA